ncbi:hypothetical protein Tco_1178681, partial [Tanacetum coccineum]
SPTRIGELKFQTLQTRLFSNAGRTGHALVSGLRLFKTYDGESFKAHEFCGKVHRCDLKSILRRADYQEYKISEKDFKNLHPNDYEDLFILNIQEKLNHLPKTDKTSLHKAINMWIRNLVIRNCVGDL